MRTMVHYLPIPTLALALAFTVALLRRYRAKAGGTHPAWWAAGTLTYAAGTMRQASITLAGWREWRFRPWYATGDAAPLRSPISIDQPHASLAR